MISSLTSVPRVVLRIGFDIYRRLAGRHASIETTAASAEIERELALFKAARVDMLTGLQTRSMILDKLSEQFASKSTLVLLVLDVDAFSDANAIRGDAWGNEILRAVADRLRTLAGTSSLVARLDGDEFAIIYNQPDDLKNAQSLAEKTLRTLTEPYPVAGELVELRFSIGGATSPIHSDTAGGLIRAAQIALRQAKLEGGGRWKFCGEEMSEEALYRSRLGRELADALKDGQIVAYYQPIVETATGRITTLEILARWLHPRFGILDAADFIPASEELGLAGAVSLALLRQASTDSQAWPKDCRLSFNVAGGQLRELLVLLSGPPTDWQRRMDLGRLDIEVSEGALLRDRGVTTRLVEVLHEHGARGCLDNFGQGYSNLSQLRDTPFDAIKISRIFIADLLSDAKAVACVQSIVSLCKGLGITIVAGGVENRETADELAGLGCDYMQGYFFSPPKPAAEIAALFESRDSSQPDASSLYQPVADFTFGEK